MNIKLAATSSQNSEFAPLSAPPTEKSAGLQRRRARARAISDILQMEKLSVTAGFENAHSQLERALEAVGRKRSTPFSVGAATTRSVARVLERDEWMRSDFHRVATTREGRAAMQPASKSFWKFPRRSQLRCWSLSLGEATQKMLCWKCNSAQEWMLF